MAAAGPSPSTSTSSSRAPGLEATMSRTDPRRSRTAKRDGSAGGGTTGIIIARMHPLERLINLVALLLETTRPLTFEEIRSTLPAYQQGDASAAKRMFERDKDVLREIGIPVELEATDSWEVEQGYRIRKDHYYLPQVSFTPEEVWALFVAAHAPGESGEAEL